MGGAGGSEVWGAESALSPLGGLFEPVLVVVLMELLEVGGLGFGLVVAEIEGFSGPAVDLAAAGEKFRPAAAAIVLVQSARGFLLDDDLLWASIFL